jgi:DNA-binding IclR family transcriptional regulator
MPHAGHYTVPAVDRAITVLETLATSRLGVTLTELSAQTGIPKSTLFRILFTLEKSQYVEQDSEKKRFDLGLKVLELGHAKLEQIDLSAVAGKYLEGLAHEVEESVYLGVLDEGEVYLVQSVDSPTVWRMVTRLGHHYPAHCTALGQVLLADLQDEELDSLLRGRALQKFTPYTIVNKKKLRKRLGDVRKRGFSIVDREDHPELLSIASPVRNHTNRAVAGMMIALPTAKSNDKERIIQLINSVKAASLALSRELGFQD